LPSVAENQFHESSSRRGMLELVKDDTKCFYLCVCVTTYDSFFRITVIRFVVNMEMLISKALNMAEIICFQTSDWSFLLSSRCLIYSLIALPFLSLLSPIPTLSPLHHYILLFLLLGTDEVNGTPLLSDRVGSSSTKGVVGV